MNIPYRYPASFTAVVGLSQLRLAGYGGGFNDTSNRSRMKSYDCRNKAIVINLLAIRLQEAKGDEDGGHRHQHHHHPGWL